MYALLDKARRFVLPIDVTLQLFDAMVVPILLYGSEIWGFQHVEMVEKLHLKFKKMLLSLNKST